MRRASTLWGTLAVLAACNESAAPLPDPVLSDAIKVVAMAMAFQTTCALTADGKLHCWGENRAGEFGNGTAASSAVPVPGGGGLSFDLIAGSMGTPRFCGLTRDGAAHCWGYNVNGEVGDGTTTERHLPVRVDTDVRFRALATSYHTCAVSVDGTAYCWGSGGGQLGTGRAVGERRPARVETTARFSSVTNGLQFSCALALSREALCWGARIGLGSPGTQGVFTPTPASGGHQFNSVSAGEEHVCASTTSGEVYCWGVLTPFADGFRAVPTRVRAPRPIVSVVSSSRMAVAGTSCGLTAQGEAFCWHSGLDAVPVPGGHRYSGLAGGHGQFCGHTPGGAAFCWRWFGGRLGPGSDPVLSEPERIPPLAAGS